MFGPMAGLTSNPYRSRIATCQHGRWKFVHQGGSASIHPPAISLARSASRFRAVRCQALARVSCKPSNKAFCHLTRPFTMRAESRSPSRVPLTNFSSVLGNVGLCVRAFSYISSTRGARSGCSNTDFRVIRSIDLLLQADRLID